MLKYALKLKANVWCNFGEFPLRNALFRAISLLAETRLVIAGLDPAIHPLEEICFLMDARVKPAHDDSE